MVRVPSVEVVRRRGRWAQSLLVAAALGSVFAPLSFSCRRRHIPVASIPELPYPRCGERELPPGEVIASGRMRPGPTSLDKNVVERFEIRRRDCLYVLTVRQEWPLGTADMEVVYDKDMLPLRAWKRMTLPGVPRADGYADIRRYELRTPEVTLKRRRPDGQVEREILRGPRPKVIIGPGRAVLTMWIRRARLPVGGRVREVALDIREQVEQIREVTLRREPDLYQPWLGRTVRVYTIYGRESVFADDNDVVIGDLSGLRPAHLAGTPEPPSMPLYGTPDPVNTP